MSETCLSAESSYLFAPPRFLAPLLPSPCSSTTLHAKDPVQRSSTPDCPPEEGGGLTLRNSARVGAAPRFDVCNGGGARLSARRGSVGPLCSSRRTKSITDVPHPSHVGIKHGRWRFWGRKGWHFFQSGRVHPAPASPPQIGEYRESPSE